MLPFGHLYERKKLLLVVVGIYCILYHLAYKYLWKDGVRSPLRTLGGPGGLLMSLFNNSDPSSTSNNVPLEEFASGEPLIAVGGAITSRKLRDVSDANVGEKFQFFHTFLPTFCRTGSPRYAYRLYYYISYIATSISYPATE